ncbi:MAG: 4Fe-4S binding protein [Bacteroidales bacterium]|nr:4Fe-4S binding protein [Bacteroidales bacterium]
MQVITSIRRKIAAILLMAGLAYPACAAVCPKGIGGCSSPGRCFLFTDTDGNALCDYTSRTASQATATDPVIGQVTTTSAPVTPGVSGTLSPDTTTSVIQNTSSGGFLDTVHLSVPLAGIVLFLLFNSILFALIRTGVLGIRVRNTLPALALSSLFALGLSLITTSIIAGDAVAGTVYALIYIGAGTLLAAYLWYTGVMTRQIVLFTAVLSALAGFVFLSPIMPMELGGIVNAVSGANALTMGVIVIVAVIVLTLVWGRVFCGNICPVGSLQELAYAVPVKKIDFRQTKILECIRLAAFAITVIAAFYLIDLMAFTGLYDFFSLTLSTGFVIAAGILLLSVFIYRPICRIICPFGVLFSIFSEFSRLRLRRTETCIGCRKCEKACPVQTAGEDDSKRECYLCGRCTGTCPVGTALSYGM